MATLEKAIRYAEQRAKQTGKRYCRVQARNGQWMIEPQEFLQSAAGRMCYASTLHTVVCVDSNGNWEIY